MTERVWTADQANAALSWVSGMMEQGRRATDEMRQHAAVIEANVSSNGHGRAHEAAAAALDEVLRDLAAEGITVRDFDRGLVDFAAVAPSGRPYWLCWVVGEPSVDWWHWPEDGFAGRTPLTDPPP
jgi:hypothetical protein